MSIDEAEQVDVTSTDGLFDKEVVATPADDTVQWRASLLQLVNWGGFGGLTTVPLAGDATMISGASGVGKSTILDAYTALMMPSDTKFNGASNDAVAGRARSAGQRNLLSYLRGAVDVVDDLKTGRPVEQLLRGKGADTWGAVAMTFVNDKGARFTAARTYYVPRRATRARRAGRPRSRQQRPRRMRSARAGHRHEHACCDEPAPQAPQKSPEQLAYEEYVNVQLALFLAELDDEQTKQLYSGVENKMSCLRSVLTAEKFREAIEGCVRQEIQRRLKLPAFAAWLEQQ